MQDLEFAAPDGRVVGTAHIDPRVELLPRARLTLRPGASVGEMAGIVLHTLAGHRLATRDADLAAALVERGVTLVRASSVMVLTLPAAATTPRPTVELGPLRDAPFEYGDIMRRAYPPGHPDHEHSEVTPEGAAATIRGYLSGDIVGPLLADASAEARSPGGALLGAIFISEMAAEDEFEGGPWISEVFVDPGHHGQGIGRALIGHAIDQLTGTGRPQLGLAVTLGSPARHLYEAMGFVERFSGWTLTVD